MPESDRPIVGSIRKSETMHEGRGFRNMTIEFINGREMSMSWGNGTSSSDKFIEPKELFEQTFPSSFEDQRTVEVMMFQDGHSIKWHGGDDVLHYVPVWKLMSLMIAAGFGSLTDCQAIVNQEVPRKPHRYGKVIDYSGEA